MAGGWQYGQAGASVGGAGFGGAGKVGAQGERIAGQVLSQVASLGPTVLNDLRIPIPGFKANIDHAIVSGRHVTLLDSKVWKPGVYFTLGGRTFRGAEPVPHADKKTLPTGVDAMRRHLERAKVSAAFRESLLLIFSPPGQQKLGNYFLYRPQGARVLTSRGHGAIGPGGIDSLARRIARHTGTASGNPQIISALAQLRYT